MSIKLNLKSLSSYLNSAGLHEESRNVFLLLKEAHSDIYDEIEHDEAIDKTDEWSEAIEAIMNHSPNMFDSKPSYLATGTEATVFQSGEKVLKMTSSSTEAAIASKLKSNSYPGVYAVYEVYKVSDSKGRPTWALAVEKLQPQDSSMYAAGTEIWGMVDPKKGASTDAKKFIFKDDKSFYDAIEQMRVVIEAEAAATGAVNLDYNFNSKIRKENLLSGSELLAYFAATRANKSIAHSRTELRGEEVKSKSVLERGRFVDKTYTELGILDYLDELKGSAITKHMQDLKDHLKYIYKTYNIIIDDISGGNYGSRNGNIVLLDLGRSFGNLHATDFVDLYSNN
jgi:hypothetical protein